MRQLLAGLPFTIEGHEVVVTGYHLGRQILLDAGYAARPANADQVVAEQGPPGLDSQAALRAAIYQQLLFAEKATHQRLRAVLDVALKPTKQLTEYIQQTVAALMHAAETQDLIDLEEAFATPLAIRTQAYVLGWPEAQVDVPAMTRWITSWIDVTTGYETDDSLNVIFREMLPAFRALVKAKQTRPLNDLVSVVAQHDAFQDETERVITLMVCFAAGISTVITTLVNGLSKLLADTESLDRLRTELRNKQTNWVAAAEELIRSVTATQFLMRWPREAQVLEGIALPARCPVRLSLVDMNHDPEVFPNPDSLNWHRANKQDSAHVAYGAGDHFCVGAPIARLEVSEVLKALVPHPRLRLVAQPQGYGPNENQLRVWGGRVSLR